MASHFFEACSSSTTQQPWPVGMATLFCDQKPLYLISLALNVPSVLGGSVRIGQNQVDEHNFCCQAKEH